MKPTQQAVLDHFINEIEPCNYSKILSTGTAQDVLELRAQFLQMSQLLTVVINEKNAEESTLRNGLSEANAV